MLVGPLAVWENVVLGREPRRGFVIDAARVMVPGPQIGPALHELVRQLDFLSPVSSVRLTRAGSFFGFEVL